MVVAPVTDSTLTMHSTAAFEFRPQRRRISICMIRRSAHLKLAQPKSGEPGSGNEGRIYCDGRHRLSRLGWDDLLRASGLARDGRMRTAYGRGGRKFYFAAVGDDSSATIGGTESPRTTPFSPVSDLDTVASSAHPCPTQPVLPFPGTLARSRSPTPLRSPPACRTPSSIPLAQTRGARDTRVTQPPPGSVKLRRNGRAFPAAARERVRHRALFAHRLPRACRHAASLLFLWRTPRASRATSIYDPGLDRHHYRSAPVFTGLAA